MLERDALVLAEAQVVDAVEGGRVHDPGALFGGDEVGVHDVVRATLLGDRVRVDGLVVEPDQVLALHSLDDLERAFEDRGAGLGEDEQLVVLLDLHVFDLGVDGERDVAGQRPRRGRPGEDRRLGILLETEADEDARIGHVVPVALRELVARQRGRAPRAVRGDAEALVDEALLPHLAQGPPHRLDVVGGQRPVRVVVVEPERHALAEGDPVVDVLVDALAAEPVEALDPDLVLDVELARDVERLLDLELDREAVGVPARLALDVEALHRLVAAEEVLEGAREDVVGAWHAVGGGRTFVEDEARPAFAEVKRLLEGVLGLPSRHQLLFQLREFHPRIDFFHGC